MPQFDIVTLGVQFFGLCLSLSFYYYFIISVIIPCYSEIKKFRIKKLSKNLDSVNNIKKELTKTLWLTKYNYKTFL